MIKDDPFFWFKENTLKIPGVKGEHVFMHISDTHIEVVDETSTQEDIDKVNYQIELWRKYKGKFATEAGEPYGEPQTILNVEALDKQMALAEEMKPEALLLTGDNLDYMHPAGAKYFAKKLAEYSGKYLVVPGNHEDPSCEGCWEAGVHTLDFEGFRIVAVDDRNKTVTREDLDALRALCDEGVPIVLMCHVPFSTPYCKEEMSKLISYFYFDETTEDENAREFMDLCVNNDAIKGILCGHVHSYHVVEYAPGKPQIIGSQGMAGAVDIFRVVG